MVTAKKTLSAGEWILLLLGVSVLFGGLVRFLPGMQAGFPLNDGGMFLSMVRDLHESRYALPVFTSYNHLQIPYAYPPFGFYIARILSDVFCISELDLLRWLPPFVNTLSIFAFYLLASELLGSKLRGALASAFYALTPGAFGWFIMGGGLTRSFGSLFLLLAVFFVLRLFREGGWKTVGLAAACGGLAILSHPEAGIHAAATCALLWIFFGRTFRSFLDSVFVALGVLALTSPWWGTVLFHHGLVPIQSALQTGSHGASLWQALYKAVFVSEGLLPLLVVLRVIGIAWGLWRRQYFLVVWVVLPYLVEPRSAPSVTFYPLTMLAALAFAEAIPHLISRLRKMELDLGELYKSRVFNAVLFFVLILLFIESGLYGFRLVNNSLKPADLQAMEWIRANTDDNASFLPLTGVQSPEIDPFVEWFPALTERHSRSTIQGYEWLLGEGFYTRYSELAELQRCASVACVEDWSAMTGLDYDFVVIREARTDGLAGLFRHEDGYAEIYSADGLAVFELREP